MSNSASKANSGTRDSLVRQLSDFRWHVAIIKISEVAIAALVVFLLAYLTVFAVERFVELSTLSRAVLLLIGVAGFGVAVPWALHRWVWRTRTLRQLAGMLARAFPRLADEILGVLELGQTNQRGASPRLIEAALQQTGEDAAREDFSTATPRHRRGVWICAAGVAGCLAVAAIVYSPNASRNAWARFLNPWSQASRFTFTQLEQLPEQLVVPYGEPFSVNSQLRTNSESQPANAIARIGGSLVTAERDGNRYQFDMPGQSSTGQLVIAAGDATQSMQIIPQTRPELVGVTAEVQLPEYLQIPEPVQIDSLSARFSILKGSEARFLLNANRDLAIATMTGPSRNDQSMQITGTQVRTALLPFHEAKRFNIEWQDAAGLAASQPIDLDVRVVADRSPECVLQNIEQRVILHDRTIPLQFSAVDDFGVKHVGVEWQGIADPVNNPNPVRGEKLLFAGGPQQNAINSASVLSPERENIPPQILKLRVFTQDYQVNGQRVYSAEQMVHVMSSEQHLAWITEQMKRWASQADAVYERELALNEENKELQRLSEQELATEENIRRLEQQAAAERQNAQRLDQAIRSGKQLVEQAMLNRQMRADQVGRWAESLQKLQDVAGNRMPEISRKLNDLADDLKNRQSDSSNESNSASGDDEGSQDSDGNQSDGSQDSDGTPSNDSKQDDGADTAEKLEGLGQQRGRSTPNDSSTKEQQDSQLPGLTQRENSMLDPGDKTDGKGGDGGQQQDRLTIPSTSLEQPAEDGGGNQQQQQGGGGQQQPPSIDDVVEDQDRLLKEFREAREAMSDLMAQFENTTFVKRLKAASLSQLEVASKLNGEMSAAFGLSAKDNPPDAELAQVISEAQAGMFETMSNIEADLNAYQSREPDDSRQKILDEMKSLQMRIKLQEMPVRLKRNLNGDALHRTEFWADTFDRWAEELVPPQQGGGGGGGGDGQNPSLPPAIILEVMRLIDDEMQLRDETRSHQQAKAVMSTDEALQRTNGLAVYQMALQEQALNIDEDIKRLPNAVQAYEAELRKVSNAAAAMGEASSMLIDGNTDEPTIAAESAAIEALLETRRNPPPSGGTPRDRNAGESDGSESLADGTSPFDILDVGGDDGPQVNPRDAGAALGQPSERVPEAYRNGLDTFLNRLRKLNQMQRR